MKRFKEALNDKNAILLVDTTLRDGEQTAGVVFSNREKLRIAKMLDNLGIHQIEAGIPVMGGDEKQVISEIASYGLRHRSWPGTGQYRRCQAVAGMRCGLRGHLDLNF